MEAQHRRVVFSLRGDTAWLVAKITQVFVLSNWELVRGKTSDSVLLVYNTECFQQLVEIDETVFVEVDTFGDLRHVVL